MIFSETIETVFSEVEITPVQSEEDKDYRRIVPLDLRITEDEALRDLEDENKRILE